jgi:hypothetical protein
MESKAAQILDALERHLAAGTANYLVGSHQLPRLLGWGPDAVMRERYVLTPLPEGIANLEVLIANQNNNLSQWADELDAEGHLKEGKDTLEKSIDTTITILSIANPVAPEELLASALLKAGGALTKTKRISDNLKKLTKPSEKLFKSAMAQVDETVRMAINKNGAVIGKDPGYRTLENELGLPTFNVPANLTPDQVWNLNVHFLDRLADARVPFHLSSPSPNDLTGDFAKVI